MNNGNDHEQMQPEQPTAGPGWFARCMNRYWWVLLALFVVGACVVDGILKILPEPMAIQMEARPDFAQTGEISLTGAGKLTLEEVEAALTFEPAAEFSVRAGEARGQYLVTVKDPRNHPYQVHFKTGPGGSEDPLTQTFYVNGQAMTVQFVHGTRYEQYDSITLRFSEQVDIESLERNLSVSPHCDYFLSYDRFEVTLSPGEAWNLANDYTITIGTDYTSMDGRMFAAPQQMVFHVAGDRLYGVPYVDFTTSHNYVLNEARDMTLIFDADYLEEKVPVVVDVYRMPSVEKYREQGHIYLDYDTSLSSLEKVDSNAYLLENGENKLSVPHDGAGAYIVTATLTDPQSGEERVMRTGYLITPLSVYLQASGRETILWLNSAREEEVVEGYRFVYGEGDDAEQIGVTDRDGVLVIPHDPDKDRYGFSIYNPAGELVYYDNADMGKYQQPEEYFYSYLFTDRTLYKPEDAVQFWGYIKPFRNNTRPVPATVTVRLDPEGLDLAVEATVDAAGTFSGEIPLERIRSSQYEVRAELRFPPDSEGGEEIVYPFEYEYISVQEYVKPSYTISSVTDQAYYGPNGTVSVTATATFFDGTPLPRFPLELAYYDMTRNEWVNLPNALTDERGNVTFSFPACRGGEEVGTAAPTTNGYRVQIASDGETVTHMGHYTVFRSDILVEAALDRQPDGKNLALTVHTYQLNLDSPQLKEELEKQPYSWWISNERLLEIAKGDPVDVALEVSLRWDYYDNRGIRRRYIHDRDYWGESILFSNDYSMDYIVAENPEIRIIEDPYTAEKRVSLRTENGVATVNDLLYLSQGASIDFSRNAYSRAWITYTDGRSNSCSAYAYYSSRGEYIEDWETTEPEPIEGYSFQVTHLGTGEDISPRYAYYQEVNLGVGETARFTLRLDGVPVESQGGRIFYSIIHDGLYEYHVTDSTSFEITQQQIFSPRANLVAVYFDGQGVRRVYQMELVANMDSMAVDIEVTPDKTSYRPGEQVTLAVRATDQQGNGVAGNLCVAVVDEAIFALSEQYISVLSDLYGDVRRVNNYVSQYFTTYRDETPPYPADGGKGGGEGVDFYDSYRSNFKDTALFLPARTDGSGNATVTFSLPDNTTSWRVTAVEIGDTLRAGQHKSNLISTLPFFVRPVFSSKFIEGDDFTMLVQGHGTLLKEDSAISYTVTVTGDNYSETKTAEGVAFEAQELNFGKLPIGQYQVVAKAQYSGYSDTVELPMNVIKSNLELVIHKEVDLRALDISAMRYPVTITLYDKENEAFVTSISSLLGHYCMQTSQRLSRVIAKGVLRETMPDQEIPSYVAETSENIADMQNFDGGIGSYVGADSDPMLTTYVLLAAGKESFNNRQMAEYFRDQLKPISASSSDEKVAAACRLGLAVLGEIELSEIDAALQQATRTDVKAYYIAALHCLGEQDRARKLYDEQLAPHLSDIENRSSARYGLVNESELVWERDTAAIWVAASLLGHGDADRISLYFGQSVWRYRTLYECMIYAAHYDKPVQPVTVGYTMKGETYRDSTGYTGIKTLVLTKSELESLRFTEVPDNLKAVAYYVGEPSEMGMEQSPNMSIAKRVSQIDDITWEIELDIKLTADAPTGQYDISDWIPSNTRLYEVVPSSGQDFYFSYWSEGQNLYATLYNDRKSEKQIMFRYHIRRTSSGEAVLDTAYMIHGDTGENCNSEKGVFQIAEPEEGEPVDASESESEAV